MRSSSIQPAMSFEYLTWIFTRVSALLLVLLTAIGFISALALGAVGQVDLVSLVRWSFFPNPNHVINSNIPDVTLGWTNAFWQIVQILIVFLGATHGFNGLRVVIEDFVGQNSWRPALRGIISLLWIFMMMLALYVILGS
jgi:succinate dehydrogenase hydrophobic anchor subunit